MRARRGWVMAAVLLLAGAAAGAGAVRQHWLSCRGSMLSGSVLLGFADGPDFSDACLDAMDRGFSFVWPGTTVARWGAESVLGTICALLLALAWVVVVLSSGWSRLTRLLAGLPALGTAAAGLTSLLGGGGDAVDSAFFRLLQGIDVLAVVAFLAIALRERPGRSTLWRVALALAASTGVGVVATVLDYAFMTAFSEADWDTPPGSGYPTVVATTLLSVALLVITLVPRPLRATSTQDLADANA